MKVFIFATALNRWRNNTPILGDHFGEHAAAAGLTLNKAHFEEFRQIFTSPVAEVDQDLFQATLWTDGILPDTAVSLGTGPDQTTWSRGDRSFRCHS
ncbi:MAG: hypothetical protein U1E88_05970 [Acinetobacter sp.]